MLLTKENLIAKETVNMTKENKSLFKPLAFIVATLAVYMLTFRFIGTINHIVFAKSILPAFIVLAIVVTVAFLWGNTVSYLLKSMERKLDSVKMAQRGE